MNDIWKEPKPQDTQGIQSSRDRAYRGGSWNFDPWLLCSANRLGDHPDFRYNDLGFRVSRTLN